MAAGRVGAATEHLGGAGRQQRHAGSRPDAQRERRSYLVLDLSQGTARTLAGPLEPANPLHLVPPAGAASLGASPLFVADKRFLRIDLETGQRHDLGPARQR
ncbi:MAG TPA: hypothetical protein VKY89_11255 [Thermoanaerobaculia bacterium]|nr:hypothetical protein [Thermoanaerobaculia bacterium]